MKINTSKNFSNLLLLFTNHESFTIDFFINKIEKDNNFIQKMLLQSVFYKMKECREYQKRVLKGSI